MPSGKDLFNISKVIVIGRKTKLPRFFGLPGICSAHVGLSVVCQCWLARLLSLSDPCYQ